MAKKYTPSGYQIIDLTELGMLSHGSEITSTSSEDSAILISVLKKVIEKKDISKPLLMKANISGYLITFQPLIILADDYSEVVLPFYTDTQKIIFRYDAENKKIDIGIDDL